MFLFCWNTADFGSSPHWVRCVFSSLGNHPHNRNWHQPCQEPWSCHNLQQRPCMGWPCEFPYNKLILLLNHPGSSIYTETLLSLQWIFWVGPFVGAALAALYHQVVIRAIPFKSGNWNMSPLLLYLTVSWPSKFIFTVIYGGSLLLVLVWMRLDWVINIKLKRKEKKGQKKKGCRRMQCFFFNFLFVFFFFFIVCFL